MPLQLTFPNFHPFTNKSALYGCVLVVSDWKLTNASVFLGNARSNVVTKNPTPAPPGRPSDRLRETQPLVSNPGKCHPSRSLNKPPSFITPRTLSEKLSSPSLASAEADLVRTETYFVYPPSFPWTFQVVNAPPTRSNPPMPRADFSCGYSSWPMLSWMTVTTLSWPGMTEPLGKGKRALTWSPPTKMATENRSDAVVETVRMN